MNSCPRRNSRRVSHSQSSACCPCPHEPRKRCPRRGFRGVPRLRHVSVESGIRLIDSVTAPGCREFGCKAHACDSCHLLKNVDLSNTQIEEIQEFTFVHCTSLKEVRLPKTLHTIRVKAFMNCAALPELAIPPSLKYIASRAFLDCTAFKRPVKLPGRHKWRGVYAEENAFAICPDMRWPPWLHMIPDTGYISGLA